MKYVSLVHLMFGFVRRRVYEVHQAFFNYRAKAPEDLS